jgi:hypothetical protein
LLSITWTLARPYIRLANDEWKKHSFDKSGGGRNNALRANVAKAVHRSKKSIKKGTK